MKTLFGIAALAALAPLVAAQPQQPRPHPADPEVRVPNVTYQSSFTGYVSYREQDIAPWRDVNDEVSRVGGHAGILRGTGHSEHAPTKPVAKSPVTPAPGIQGGEHK
jgi:hypothetical protein